MCKSDFTPYAVCVRPEDVVHAYKYVEEYSRTKIKVVSAVGFPHGNWYSSNYKTFEAQISLEEGASEIDMVLNYTALKQGDHGFVLQEIQRVNDLVHAKGAILKIILETSELNDEQIAQACHLASHAGVDFVKTSTGFGTFGAKYEHLEIIRKNFQGGIKISGGVNALNVHHLLTALADEKTGKIEIDPTKIRIGESLLLEQFTSSSTKK